MYKIFIMFSVENNYDQPPNNYVCGWANKPTLNQIAQALDMAFPHDNDDITLAICNLYKGEQIRLSNYNLRIEEVELEHSFWSEI